MSSPLQVGSSAAPPASSSTAPVQLESSSTTVTKANSTRPLRVHPRTNPKFYLQDGMPQFPYSTDPQVISRYLRSTPPKSPRLDMANFKGSIIKPFADDTSSEASRSSSPEPAKAIDSQNICPCSLIGHECAHKPRCDEEKHLCKGSLEEICGCIRVHIVKTCSNLRIGRKCMKKSCTLGHEKERVAMTEEHNKSHHPDWKGQKATDDVAEAH